MQPVVIKNDSGRWEVIDGQQRLTTIYIILNYIYSRLDPDAILYTIEYKSRPGSERFLKEMVEAEKSQNIDYFHMWQARETIDRWFKTKGNFLSTATKFYPVLLENTMIIWYEVGNSQPVDAIGIFTRLNMGKIPLTDAELIKALFLKSENFQQNVEGVDNEKRIRLKQLEIAGEWDRIEQALQNDDFWYFLTSNEPPDGPRIEFLLDIMTGKTADSQAYHTFRYFYKQFEGEPESEILVEKTTRLWNTIKQFSMALNEWFNDHELYHLIGYLLTVWADSKRKLPGHDIQALYRKSEISKKDQFRTYLRQQINLYVEGDIDALKYKDREKVKNVLLLFNIQTLLNNSDSKMKFQFERYKSEYWDIEHIHAVKSRMPERPNQQKEWLEILVSEMGNKLDKGLKSRSEFFISNNGKIETELFENIFNDVVNKYSEANIREDLNEIGNLTLLDATTNRGYKNAIFPVKRKKIIERDEQGTFVPLCTKNAFLKHYTESPDQLTVWSLSDRNAYLTKIKSTLKSYNI